MRNRTAVSGPRRALGVGVVGVIFIVIFAVGEGINVSADGEVLLGAVFGIGPVCGGGVVGGGLRPAARAISWRWRGGAARGWSFRPSAMGGAGAFSAAVFPRVANGFFNREARGGGRGVSPGPKECGFRGPVANDKHWGIGTCVQTKFPNGTMPLTVKTIYGNGNKKVLSDYALSIATVSEHYTAQLDQFVFVKLASGVSPAEGRKAIDRV